VDLHPLEKSFDQSVALGSDLDDRGDASLTEILEESADAREDLSSAIPRGPWTPARRAVPVEPRKGLLVDRRQAVTPAPDPDGEVRDGVEVESGNLGLEPVPEKSPLVLIEEPPEDSRPYGGRPGTGFA
jgi:hypothetical protein